MAKRIRLNVNNVKKWRDQAAQDFEAVLFDPNNDCNIHCVYCHNPRSKEIVETEEFRRFLYENVKSVARFQVGCVMEPTLDPRLADLLLLVAMSPAKPTNLFRLQTNGILLHRHDLGKMREAGLTVLSVSLDSADPAAFRELRGGSNLPKIARNLADFRAACPSVKIMALTTVTSRNIGSIDELVRFGLDLGVAVFNIRQMFYYPGSPIVDHSRMPSLVVSQRAFAEMQDRITAEFGHAARFSFQSAEPMVAAAQQVTGDSRLPLSNWKRAPAPATDRSDGQVRRDERPATPVPHVQ